MQMDSMPKFLRLCLLALAIVTAGCIIDENGSSRDSGEYLDSYFPLNPKLVRKYLVTSYSDSQKTLSYSERSFAGKRTINGKEYYILETEGTDRPSYYRMENDVLYRYYFEGEKINVPYSHEEPILDLTKNTGESWMVVSSTITEETVETVYTVKATFQGMETVETIAGTFTDCARFDTRESVVYTPVNNNTGETLILETYYRSWYAKRIGLVKVIAEGNLLGNYIIDLYSYSL